MEIDKPTITIIGLLPGQANRVESEYGDRIDFRFLLVDTHVSKMKATAESSDHIILMTKFVNHGVQSALRKHEGLTHCNGGVSSVELKLDEILKTQS